MTLAYYDVAPAYEEARTKPSPEMTDHLRTYRKFVFFARCAALAVPLFMAFLLHWTT